MPSFTRLSNDDARLEPFLRRDAALHLYQLGDLDEPYASRCCWWGAIDARGALEAVVMLYQAEPATVLAMGRPKEKALAALLSAIAHDLPDHFHAHLSPEALDALRATHQLEQRIDDWRMALTSSAWRAHLDAQVVTLGPEHLEAVEALLSRSYASHFFREESLQMPGANTGIFTQEGVLVAMSSVHVWAPERGVVAIGSVATDPDHRNQGLATRVVAAACARFEAMQLPHVGLNVHQDNSAAIRCYERLGFTLAHPFHECVLRRKSC